MHRLLIAVLLLLTASANLFAQATASATLLGTVIDKTGAVIPNAEVRVLNTETQSTRSIMTTGYGTYRFDLLSSGNYEVRVSAIGFAAETFKNVVLAVSRTTTVDATLSPGAQATTVTVEASGGVVDTNRTDVSFAVTPQMVQDLPLNGRDFGTLALLAPGARPVNSYDPTKNRVAVFAVDGSDGRNINATVNGIDNKDNTIGGTVMQLPLEAVQEFNISTQRFSAANGRSEGAAVNVITKSGTNNFHGSLYFFDRNDAFNTLNYFEKTENGGSGVKGPFSRQQFGGSIGGPLKKDKAFVFFALERTRESTSITESPTAYNELVLAQKAGVGSQLGLAAQPATVIPTPFYEWRYNGRLDYRLSEKHTLSMVYSNQNNNGLNDQANGTMDLTAGNFTTNQLILSSLTLNSVLSPHVVNVFTAGYQYWNNLIATDKLTPAIWFPDDSFGSSGDVPQQSFQRKWQFKDDVAINQGAHSLKLGFDFVYEPIFGGLDAGGHLLQLTFADDLSVIEANKAGYPQGISTPGAVISMTQTSGTPNYQATDTKQLGLYFQDDWKIKRNLTINLGVRWDKDWNFFGDNQLGNNRGYLLLKAINSPWAGLAQDDNKDFSPRLGLAWDVKGNGKHTIRLGYGLYYGQPNTNETGYELQQSWPLLYTHQQIYSAGPGDPNANVVPGTNILLSNWRFGLDPLPPPPPPLTQLANGSSVYILDKDYRNPYTEQWNAGYTWAFNGNSAIEVEYAHVLGLHECKQQILNPEINGVRWTDSVMKAAGLPVISTIYDASAIGRSRYDGMSVSYRRRMSRHFSVNSTYTLSRAMGYEGSAASFFNRATDLLNMFASHDFGPTPSDERHRVVISGVVSLPWGINFAPIMQLASARPYNATQGSTTDVFGYGGGQSSTQVILLKSDPSNLLATKTYSLTQLRSCLASGACYEGSYDMLRGQTFFELDARFSKTVKFREKAQLQLIFQAFNLTNRANFGNTYQGNIQSPLVAQPIGFSMPSAVLVPKSFAGEFGARFSF